MKRTITYISLAVSMCLLFNAAPTSADTQDTSWPPVILSEVQTGGLQAGAEDGRQEFIELHNSYDTPYVLDGLRLEYLSASHPGNGPPTRVLAILSGSILPGAYLIVSHIAYLPAADFVFAAPGSLNTTGLLARTGGQVRLVGTDNQLLDVVTWGTAARVAPWWGSAEIPAGQSIQRILPNHSNNSVLWDYYPPSAAMTPGAAGQLSDSSGNDPSPHGGCSSLMLTEILPNATGIDAGKEFIEVHNFGDQAINLAGCELRLGSQSYVLPQEWLTAGAYQAFYDSQSGLVLPNTTGQTIYLTSAQGEQPVLYPDGLADDMAWAFIDGSWQVTTTATPGASNQLSLAPPKISVVPETPKACEPGKERNLETGRCRTIPNQASDQGCPAGQARNPATNRCRMTGTGGTIRTPCRPDQERSPETNRCRAVLAAGTAPKSCPAGQARNAETNRCRKVVSAANNLASVTDMPGESPMSNYRGWIVASILIAAAGYGLYEWRHDLANALKRLKRRLISDK